MEQNTTQKTSKSSSKKVNTIGIRVDKNTKRQIARILDKINKKQFGKRVKTNQLISLALNLVTEEHYKQLQEQSLSNADKLEQKYRKFVSENGAISKDEFIGKLLSETALNLGQK